MKWILTDPACNQYMMKLTDTIFKFKEDRLSDPITGSTYLYESEIHLNEYTQEEMFEAASTFGYSFNTIATWIDEGENLDLIAECIFEMEN
jgi:hypothetical protein